MLVASMASSVNSERCSLGSASLPRKPPSARPTRTRGSDATGTTQSSRRLRGDSSLTMVWKHSAGVSTSAFRRDVSRQKMGSTVRHRAHRAPARHSISVPPTLAAEATTLSNIVITGPTRVSQKGYQSCG
ncbi:unnamed protein product [Prorocentrum cordatum]|uniref:Uncharacterized protein n=1 Tax=Prorocentrum cordatum TaxID=2364126 RepID=A0ABN9WDI3_9DINO|nr:unnamed protein product [Polarella glacialis]